MRQLDNIICIDPAVHRFGCAVFQGGVLVHGEYHVKPDTIPLDDLVYVWVLEAPKDYVRFGVAHPALEGLRLKLRTVREFAKARGERVKTYTPSAWKGNVPKVVHHRRCWAVLHPRERTILRGAPNQRGYEHDIHDAVALGLTALGRVRRGGLT